MIIFLNGSKDAGKTTTARLLQQWDERIAVVEPDVFFSFLPPHLPLDTQAPHCIRMSADAARYLDRQGYIVLIAYPLTDSDYARHRTSLADAVAGELPCITLAPGRDALIRRLGLEHDMSNEGTFRRACIEAHYRDRASGVSVIHTGYSDVRIDTDGHTPEETARVVHRVIQDMVGS